MFFSVGRYKALLIEFDLQSSSYATMVLREVLKSNTATSAQAKLNKYHDSKEKMICVEQNNSHNDRIDLLNAGQTNSLLSNPEKYEQFKNSIFKDILGSTKRKSDGDEIEAKKLKLEENSL